MTNIPESLKEVYQKLVREVHAPIFFDKLAKDYGIVPQSAEEEEAYLELAGILQNLRASEKMAGQQSPIVAVVDELKAGLSHQGHNLPTSYDRDIEKLASTLVNDDKLVEAACAWGMHLTSM